ncbi:MAG: FeoA family protein [Capsulimonas sp.]|uniref:FeoA family protein n=1 Tax=Capsulimonas sp. TaxID=2494211 RepID=UPI0032658D2A|nr:ferrous iron transport protein [Capsulimonas sp.]
MPTMTPRKTEQDNFFSSFQRWRGAREDSRRAAIETSYLRFGAPDETGHIMMPLSAMHPGDYGHVVSLDGDAAVRQHLQEMGFTAGTQIEFVRCAPLMDPITVLIRGYQLSLRRREADAILVRRCPPDFEG